MKEQNNLEDLIKEKEEELKDQQVLYKICTGEHLFSYNKEEHGFDLDVIIKEPTIAETHNADLFYSKTFNKLLKDPDQLTNNQLIEISKSRGILTEDDAEELVTIDEKIAEIKELFSKETKKAKKEKLDKEVSLLRQKKLRLAILVGSITSTSIENLANTEKSYYFLLNCVYKLTENDKELLYENREALNNETDLEKLQKILLDARSVWFSGGLTDFLQLDG